MSRVMKFRAWSGTAMEYGGFSIHATGLVQNESRLSLVNEQSPIMQYTGLKDKNGKGSEMWQHDIVYCAGHGLCKIDQNVWGEWCAYAKNGDVIPIHDLIMEGDLCEIVGNTHEHPELLKGE